MKNFSIVCLFILTIVSTSTVTAYASEVNGAQTYATSVGCGHKQEFYEAVEYYCSFYNGSSTDHVFARMGNYEYEIGSGAEGNAGVWLNEVGSNNHQTTICRNDEYLNSTYVDHVQCDNSSYNRNKNFKSYGKYNDLKGDWRSARSSVE